MKFQKSLKGYFHLASLLKQKSSKSKTTISKMYSLKSRLLLFFILAIGIIIILQTIVFQYIIKSTINRNSSTYFQEIITQASKHLDLQFQHCEELADRIDSNQVIINLIKDVENKRITFDVAKYGIIRETGKFIDPINMDGVYLFMIDNKPINCFYTYPKLEMDSYSRYLLYDSPKKYNMQKIWFLDNSPPFNLSLNTMIVDKTTGHRVGLLLITFSDEFLYNTLNDIKMGNKGNIFLVDNTDHVVFSNDHDKIAKPYKLLLGNIVYYNMVNNGWKLIGVVSDSETTWQIMQFNLIFTAMILIVLSIIGIFTTITFISILRPLNKIMVGMNQIQKGNLSIKLEAETNDVFGVIINNFNYMVERIKSLIDTVYHQQINYQKAEMAALQAKLNPHFLYNTLDMIYWMLIMRQQDEIGEVVISLSNILRYSISKKNEFVMVNEDMEQLETYLKIQKMRFREKLFYSIDIQNDMLDYEIPKLLLQPLVENSIKHGFCDMRYQGNLQIYGYISNNDLFFVVEDDGVGISSEKISDIYSEYELQNKKSGIGVSLVHNRIRYIYGEDYGITIESTLGKGTKIKIKLKQQHDSITGSYGFRE